ncbi:S49 family peptidase [Ancylobacter dichloromethanicus]|uniref:Peptidase S49 n=1 Tax=Ancylobacter dichloromethanicus TaxID=518825 RepID=A0A9W6J8P3_9HYPH|nr:S49 family peptidase [Ancylobacter dichloromethanicus]MBS7552526.1 S49 family peptidase [Ancylobacter dichloromethanicus]GLK71886.1 peptidase S49 [Ancylobacter dichloromethanicus]
MANSSFFADFRRRLDPFLPAKLRGGTPVVPVVRLNGAIGMSSPFRPGITFANTAKTLDRAFATKGAKAVALVINSPGGAPTQSHLVYRRIRALAQEKQLPVIAFVEDVAASGGYMLACAADEIVADTFSILGSIGVVSAGFGFPGALEKLGIERRVYTAGTRKVMLDPFQPEKAEDIERLKALQQEIHAGFVGLVKERRGDVLSGDDDTLFSGEFWVAPQAQALGLVDSIGDLRGFLRARYGEQVRTPLIEVKPGLFGRRSPGVGIGPGGLGGPAAEIGAGAAQALISAAEERALWSRFGL